MDSIPSAASNAPQSRETTGSNPSPYKSSSRPPHNSPENRRSHSKPFQRGDQRGRGGRGHGKKRNLGRSEWAKLKVDKRKRNDEEQAAKRRKVEDAGEEGVLPIYATKYTEEELKEEARRPKKKVAVLIGYAGTGYRGMQFVDDHKTIEGDLFKAFVDAGAISKANADDPKKSSFVRCARTDKGVHAAGNVISLKLIVEDEDVVKKINEALVPQIRVWGFERTNNSFSAYQMVDSRIYEYLIPSHSFLPPHPRSFMGRKCEAWAKRREDVERWKERQMEVERYWERVDEEVIKPILAEYDEATRSILEKALFLHGDEVVGSDSAEAVANGDSEPKQEAAENNVKKEVDGPIESSSNNEPNGIDQNGGFDAAEALQKVRQDRSVIQEATRRLRAAYLTAKRAYRIPEKRLNRVKETLNLFVGTKNYHNFTVDKTFKDPSAKRVIKSFIVNPQPILINGTEWLSLKVHGQSFMMHQIRKMVGMAALIVRCGTHPSRMVDALGPDAISIPKAPALGLLLERPVFETYNKKAKGDMGKETIDFDKYKKEMDDFKQKEIYERMYHDEEKENVFGNFFNHVDNFPESTFLYVTSGGVEATKEEQVGPKGGLKRVMEEQQLDSDDEVDEKDDKLGNEG